MQHTANFHAHKNDNFYLIFFTIFLILLKNIDCGYSLNRLSGVVLTCTHNLCFRGLNIYTPVNPSFTIKSGVRVRVGINYTDVLS